MSNQEMISPDQSQLNFEKGEKLYQQGQFQAATQAYLSALNFKPRVHVCYLRLGQIFVHLCQYSEAISQYKKALEVQPDFVTAHHCLGYALHKNEQYSEAIESYKKAIELKPSSSSVTYLKLGELLEKQSQFQAAINIYKKAIELEPNVSKNYATIGSVLLKKNDVKGAIDNYRKAIEIDANNLESYYNLGLILTNQKNYEQAAEYFLKALKQYPGYHLAYQGIAYLLEKEGIHNPDIVRLCYAGRVPKFLLEKFCKSERKTYCQLFNESEAIEYIALDTEYEADFVLPLTVYATVDQSFPKSKKIKETFVIKCRNAFAYGDGINSAIFTQNGNLVQQASTGNYELVSSEILNRDPIEVEGKVLFLPTKFGGGNYYHWMFDTIARIGLLEKAGIDLETIDKFVVYTCQSRFQQETLKNLGVSEIKVIESRHSPVIKAQEIIIPSPTYSYPSQWACDFLKKVFLGKKKKDTKEKEFKKIYISRKNTSHRQVVNEEELIAMLKNKGFESVTLELMSVFDQARLLSECEVVIAPHGGGLSNILFCTPATKVIEIFSKNYINPCYYMLSSSCHLIYSYILADEVMDCNSGHRNRSDLLVDLDRVNQVLSLNKI